VVRNPRLTPDSPNQPVTLCPTAPASISPMKAFQDYYPENVSHCYGCGSSNVHGHRIKTNWDGEESVTWFTPEPFHTAVPGYAYGGLIASLIDCHSTGTAAAAMYRAEEIGRASCRERVFLRV